MSPKKSSISHKKKRKQSIDYLYYASVTTIFILVIFSYMLLSLETKKKSQLITCEISLPSIDINQERTINSAPTIPSPMRDHTSPQVSLQPKISDMNTKNITTTSPKEHNPKTPLQVSDGCKLAIILDDIATPSQMRELQKIPLEITPSIFPPSELSSTSHLLAKNSHAMVHLPLESKNRQMNTMQGTLFVRDSPQDIYNRIKELRTLFPYAKYINNHTGGVFTADKNAMSTLYSALMKYEFIFVDSLTSKDTYVPHLANKHQHRYLARDVFLDNVRQKDAIRNQLKKAVKIAKKHGVAIAIGHPYPETFAVLRESNSIFEGVEVVYIDRLYGGEW
ncbi:MAG TPA: divergent polysaccharide deacetylase family protein [Epsilonproteobacteria bacterium]|nr:divergent polysaccharide deacetylase family protein [Campylobacterota bacterium]